ncbi:DUF4376 domain-containing protein [Vibrio hannami]|uniref:DUF4376 domain-containing protein n=1 Tax=Vibrio hannami TaxID=2717094 RepID=UPI00240FBBCF|nr:DUF4376 domain-containing protein [Vibrio hannami]MDG3089242.1 DUF4376 domain-containing protein [Vibrio hannami]
MAAYRFEREEGGITFNSQPLATDRVTQAKITAAYVKAQADATYTIASWKFAPGVFAPLNAAAITAAANAIEAHIQACFSREAVLSANIMAAADDGALDAVDITTGWSDMNLQAFFSALRRRESGVFGTSLTQAQVDGCEGIIAECVAQGADLGQTAYILATAYGETGGRMQPVEESLWYRAPRIKQVFSKSRRQGLAPEVLAGNPRLLANTVYGGAWGRKNLGNTEPGDGWKFIGRGIGQITGRRNYAKWGARLGVDLIKLPEAMMHRELSTKALVRPMLEGWATGHKLSDFVDGPHRDYHKARRVWNGNFEAGKYAGYAVAFERALAEAGYDHRKPPPRPSRPMWSQSPRSRRNPRHGASGDA